MPVPDADTTPCVQNLGLVATFARAQVVALRAATDAATRITVNLTAAHQHQGTIADSSHVIHCAAMCLRHAAAPTKQGNFTACIFTQVCIFRNSVRRALKGISQALERVEGSQAGAADTAQVCRAVTTVVAQIVQSVQRLQQVIPLNACPHLLV